MKRFPREVLLMLAPVALLGGLGWMLRDRKPAVLTFNKPGPFAPFIKRVQILPARPIDVFDGYDTRVLVELDAHGAKPAWWNKGFGGYESGNAGQVVLGKNGQLKSLARQPYRQTPHLDNETKTWKAQYLLKLADIAPRAGQIRLRDSIKFINISTSSSKMMAALWLDAPIRAFGTASRTPLVSHQPKLSIEKFWLDEAPPVDSHGATGRWRTHWTLRKNISLAGEKNDYSGVELRLHLVNKKGQKVGDMNGSSSSGPYDAENPLVLPTTPDPRRDFQTQDFALDKQAHVSRREPLWLQGEARWGDAWPLVIKIPIRDGAGQMLFAPRNATVPFRVVSVARVAPSSDEKSDVGADSMVSVVLQGVQPATDLSKWRWEAVYSQHLRDARGKLLWELSFKRGKSSISPSYTWGTNTNRIEIRYPLVLGSIPASRGKLVFEAQIAANRSVRVPVQVVVRP